MSPARPSSYSSVVSLGPTLLSDVRRSVGVTQGGRTGGWVWMGLGGKAEGWVGGWVGGWAGFVWWVGGRRCWRKGGSGGRAGDRADLGGVGWVSRESDGVARCNRVRSGWDGGRSRGRQAGRWVRWAGVCAGRSRASDGVTRRDLARAGVLQLIPTIDRHRSHNTDCANYGCKVESKSIWRCKLHGN